MILNPGFEEGLNWWSTWGGQTLSTNPLDAATGVNACFVLDGVAGGFAQDVTLPVGGAGKTYLFKAKVKTTGMPQLAQTGCKLFEGTKEINSPSYITVENKDIPYTEYVYAIETTAATTKAQIWVWKNATGSIYLDDYSFAEVDLASGLKTNSLLESLSVYPNPAKDVVNIDFQSKIENAQVSISDLTGKSVYKNSINSVNKIRISTANFAKGIYVLSISTKGETSNMKLVVQ
ncbi:T9SS type A sorting domain-containing protein [bacterium]|nr:T9SS type A sorting domain-containing protein [bacterium]